MSYQLSFAAEQDLINMYLEGAENFGRAQADAYQNRIDGVIHLLAANPEMARLRTEVSPPVRVHPILSHVIIYEIDGEGITIVRVRHQRENWNTAQK